MSQPRPGSLLDWLLALTVFVLVLGAPAAVLAWGVGYSAASAVVIGVAAMGSLLLASLVSGLVLRIPAVRAFVARELDPESKTIQALVRLAALQAGDPMAGALARRHEREASARPRDQDPES